MSPARSDAVDLDRIRRAREAGGELVRRTPVLGFHTLAEVAGGPVALKAESLQRTGSFKLRGALSKIAALGEEAGAGVVAASAGNHAHALAYAAAARSVPCEVFMPAGASIAKTEAATELGAVVHLGGESVDECMDLARQRADETGRALVHPFDDPDVIAGQGGVGLELLDQVPDLTRVVVPVGGGGLVSGIAIAVKSARPEVSVIGVQAAACAPYAAARSPDGDAPSPSALTIADGIAVKRPGQITGPLVQRWVDDVVAVGEDDVAEAMVFLVERAKLVVEGAGAVGTAALLGGQVRGDPGGTTVVVLSGGNVDAGLLASVTRRHETEAGRRLAFFTKVADRPGALARLLVCVGETGANLVDVEHVREGVDLHVRESAVHLVLETRGRDHAREVLDRLAAEGYESRVLG